jgi:class 3 adenylate cyclase
MEARPEGEHEAQPEVSPWQGRDPDRQPWRQRLVGSDQRRQGRCVPIVAPLGGRIVQIVGDGLLLEFPSVVAAVECAVAIQKMMVERNADTPEDKRIVYRIGVNLGDVLIDGDGILGDGVNIAARLESLCEPGSISISRLVYDQIDGKLALGFRNLGPQKLKNITKPVEVFAIDYMDKTDDAPTPDDAKVAQTIKLLLGA